MGKAGTPQDRDRQLGLRVFGSLRAEDEPWLAECFVPPTEFELMAEAGSLIVFGGPGMGKSAVREMLVARARRVTGEPSYLLVYWQPNPLVWAPAVGFQSVPGQVAHIFDLCASAAIQYLALHQVQWNEAPEWAKNFVRWFVQRFTQGDWRARFGEWMEQSGEFATIVQDVFQTELEEDFLPLQNWPLVASEFTKAIRRIGLNGVWVIVDGVGVWLERDPDRLRDSLVAFFRTLPLFEQASFAYKAFIPADLQSPLAAAAGLERRRLASFQLNWSESQLLQIAERRLALALGKPDFTLQQLCADSGLLEWLKRVGGDCPRAWLELLRPLVGHYLSSGRDRPVEDWRNLCRRAPPRLVIDEASHRIIIGGRVIRAEEIPAGAYRLLLYLYHNAGRIVPWDELYYRGYRNLDRVPRPADEDYEAPANYEGILYSRISDLRKAIEPFPRDPVYLETLRDKGVRLRLQW